MRTVGSSLFIEEKRKLANTPINLLHLDISDTIDLWLCDWSEDVTYKGQTYAAYPFEISGLDYKGGDVPAPTITLANVDRSLQVSLERNDGMRGRQVTIRTTFLELLDDDQAYIDETLTVDAVAFTETKIELSLSSTFEVFDLQVPFYQFTIYCRWIFKSAECGYTGPATECAKTRKACRGHNNLINFGGFPSMLRRPLLRG